VAHLHAVFGDPEAMRYSTCGVQSYAQCEEDMRYNLVERFPALRPLGERMMARKDDGIIVGWCGLQRSVGIADTAAEVTYNVIRAFWGYGYATEAAAAMLHHGFCDLRLEEIIAVINKDNQRSIRVAEKLELRRRADNGNAVCYRLIREEYLADDYEMDDTNIDREPLQSHRRGVREAQKGMGRFI